MNVPYHYRLIPSLYFPLLQEEKCEVDERPRSQKNVRCLKNEQIFVGIFYLHTDMENQKAKILCTHEVPAQRPFLITVGFFFIRVSLLYALENSESGELQRTYNIT